MKKRKICVVTGTRAEYGLLYWLMKEIKDDKDLELQIIATGMHLSNEFGLTYKKIERDGFNINKKIEMLLSSDSEIGITKSIGLGCISASEAIKELNPDMVVLLGDRYEILSFAIASLIANIPIAHIHGGESTQGAIDEAIRHSITKMAHIHFPSTDKYKKRIIQLGENPDRVFNFGALGLDNIYKLNLLNKKELEKELNFNFENNKTAIFTYHPVTLENDTSKNQIITILKALEEEDLNVIFTEANADTHGRIINREIKKFVENKNNRNNYVSFKNLGQLNYLSTLKHVDLMIGNSSSGLIEAPSFNLPVINIGDRQKGRIRGENVIDVECNKYQIKKAIEKAFSDDFAMKVKNISNPYDSGENGEISKKIKNKLKEIEVNEDLLKKKFFDLKMD